MCYLKRENKLIDKAVNKIKHCLAFKSYMNRLLHRLFPEGNKRNGISKPAHIWGRIYITQLHQLSLIFKDEEQQLCVKLKKGNTVANMQD